MAGAKVALEYEALGIVPVVVTISSLPVVEQAFQVSRLDRGMRLAPPSQGASGKLQCFLCDFPLLHWSRPNHTLVPLKQTLRHAK